MGFVEDAQRWLKWRLEAQSTGLALPDSIDLNMFKSLLYESLEVVPLEDLDSALNTWERPGYLYDFIAKAAHDLRAGIGAGWSAEVLTDHLQYALELSAKKHSGPDPDRLGGRTAVAAVVYRTAGSAMSWAEHRRTPPVSVDVDIEAWFHAIQLLSYDGTVTDLGRTFLNLTGREATHFLIEIEVHLSTGIADNFRVSSAVLDVLRGGGLRKSADESWEPYSVETLERMQRLGLVRITYGHPLRGGPRDLCELTPDATSLVQAVLDPQPNPLRALLLVLLEAERSRATHILDPHGTTDVDMVYVRIIDHELRNALYPLNSALGRLWRELESETQPNPKRINELRERVDASVHRLAEFSKLTGRLSDATRPQPFSLDAAIHEAVASTVLERNGRIHVSVGALPNAAIEGSQFHWVLVFVNLLRNAAQARAGSGRVWISAEWSLGGTLQVYVDDDGPGVPEELQERIFAAGVSLRGGTGQGLFEVRRTVQATGGTIRYLPSPHGGARFHIAVPARSLP